jgi:ribonuclease III
VEETVSELQAEINYVFQDRNLLVEALTHSSYSNEVGGTPPLKDNERLEFLGDAVIGLVVAKALMERFPDATEGRLSRYRSHLVSRKTLAELAWETGFGNWVLLGRGERRTGGAEKRSILAGTFEAIIGALYQEAGLEVAASYLNRVYEAWYLSLDQKLGDMKTFLQEKTQGMYKATPIYTVVDSWGREHEKHFRVAIEIQGRIIAHGDGRSKKEAEQAAAEAALENLGM